jgi:dienelactone hydrolase
MKLRSFILIAIAIAIPGTKTGTFAVHAQTAEKKFTEREVSFAGGGGLQVHGTLVVPAGAKGKVPGVLLLPGSGPTDRNGNQAPQMVTDLLKQIAERLGTDGYASLRFDKRAAQIYMNSFPHEAAALGDFFSWDNFVGDARGGLDLLQSQPEIDPKHTVIAGHSEGAIIAIQVAHDLEGKSNAPAALILLSSPGRTLGAIIKNKSMRA